MWSGEFARSKWFLTASLTFLAASSPTFATPQGQSSFRSSTEAVLVDVSVRNGRKSVPALRVEDFQLFDNGIEQRILSVTSDPRPIDLTLIVDVSASVTGDIKNRLLTNVPGITKSLGPADQLDLVLLTDQVEHVTPQTFYRRATESSGRRLGDGGTPLYDAIAAAILEPSRAGRKHLVICLTDGIDTSSVLWQPTLEEISKRSEATVYVVAISDAARAWLFVRAADAVFPTEYDRALARIAEGTGGGMLPYQETETFSGVCAAIIEDLRGRYTLTYVPEGVARTGWHELKVKTVQRSYEVSARRGYWGRAGSAPVAPLT